MVCGQSASGGLNLPWDGKARWHRGMIDGIDVVALPLAYSNRTSLGRRAWIFLRFAWRSMGIALRWEYDLLFATSTPLTAALPGIAMKMLRRGKPFIFEVRDLWPELPRALGMKNPLLLGGMSVLEWLGYRTADACVALAPGIADAIRHRAPPGRRIVTIPNGCDLALFTPENRRAPLNLAGIEPGDFVAGFTGAHGIANGLDAVLDAAAELRRRGRHDIKLVLIGDGNQKDRLVERARVEGLSNCLFFPPVKKTEIARITASFDCGLQILANVSAFYYGTSPNKFFDYIACGLPVINNYSGWLADMINEHRIGLAVPPGDAARLAGAVMHLADNQEIARGMALRARKFAEETFDREKLAENLCEVIETFRGTNKK